MIRRPLSKAATALPGLVPGHWIRPSWVCSFSSSSSSSLGWADYPRLGTAVARLVDESVIRVSGKDAAQFLQGLVTQDVRDIVSQGSAYAGWLNNRGRLITTTLISTHPTGERPQTLVGAGPHDFLIQCSSALAARLIRHMKLYTLRSKVTFEDLSQQLQPVVVFGPAAAASLPGLTASGTVLDGIPAAVVDPRHEQLGLRLLLSKDAPLPAALADALTEVPAAVYRDWLSTQGVPCPERDVVPGESLPLNFNLDLLRGVSFEKGCYLGQELTARTHFQGLIRKRFLPFLLLPEPQPTSDPTPAAPVSAADSELGIGGADEILRGQKALGAADLARALPDRLFPLSLAGHLQLTPELQGRLREAQPHGGQPLGIAGLRRGKPHTVGELTSWVGCVGAGELRLEGSVDWSATGVPPKLQLAEGEAALESVASVVPMIPAWWPATWADQMNVEAATAE